MSNVRRGNNNHCKMFHERCLALADRTVLAVEEPHGELRACFTVWS